MQSAGLTGIMSTRESTYPPRLDMIFLSEDAQWSVFTGADLFPSECHRRVDQEKERSRVWGDYNTWAATSTDVHQNNGFPGLRLPAPPSTSCLGTFIGVFIISEVVCDLQIFERIGASRSPF